MMCCDSPKWLRFLEKYLGWLAIPNIAILFVTLQAAGFLFVMLDPVWLTRLSLIPEAVKEGEVWRLVTFLALPISLSPIWVIFVLWFLYFIIGSIESMWGAFQTTFYILLSVLLTIAFSFTFDYPVTSVAHLESTLFLAAAALFPSQEIRLFLLFPVKMKWLGWLAIAGVAIEFIRSSWLDRLYLITIYSNYILFFGPVMGSRIKNAYRRWRFKRMFGDH
jgi:hypothetical protein